MPIFEYECGSCGHRFEELMGRADPDPGCPTCESAAVTRLMSQTSFRLKGAGWYATDYGNGSRKAKDPGNETGQDTKEKADAGTSSTAGTSGESSAGSEKTASVKGDEGVGAKATKKAAAA
jgi:putative FmdB family regulatory protein